MKDEQIIIGGKTFQRMGDAQIYLQSLLSKSEIGEQVTSPEDSSVLAEILKANYSRYFKIKDRQIIGWTTKGDTAGGKAFAAMLNDGTKLSFSYRKSLKQFLALKRLEY